MKLFTLMMTGVQSRHVFQILLVIVTVHPLLQSHKDKRCLLVLLEPPTDKLGWKFTVDTQKRKLANKDEHAAKERKGRHLQVKFKWNINQIMERIADCGDVDTCFSRSSRHAARGMSWKLIYQCNEESVFDKKDDDVPLEVMSTLPFVRFILSHVVVFINSLSHVWLLVNPGTAAHQASLSFTISQSLFKFKSIESVMLANHLISVEPYSFFIQSFPASGSLPMSRVSTSLFLAAYCAGLCQLCLILGKSTDWSPPGSSIHGILQARVLEWIAIIFSRGIFPTQVSHITGRFFAIWAAREAQEYWNG